MANTIRIKRRPSTGPAGAPSPASSLYNGELAFNENDNILYYAYGSGVGGVAQSVPAIAGSGAYSLRGGTNATGTWPISINGNAAYATNAVYTTGTQTINGVKTFISDVVIGDPVAGKVTIYGSGVNGGKIVGSTSIEIPNATFSSQLNAANLLTVNGGGVSFKVPNTSSNSVGYFAVFDSNPSGTLTQIKSVSKDQILDDIGAATSGLDINAGSGLVGGGTLSQNMRFDIGQGDGISVSADSISVDSTVVRTTGTQAINGIKTFGNIVHVVATGNALSMMNIGGLNPQSNVVPGRLIIAKSDNDIGKITLGCLNINSDAVASFTNTQIELASSTSSNVTFLISPTGYYDSNISDYTGAVTSGHWRASTILTDKGGTGRSSYSNGQLLIGSGTSLAANTLTQGSNVQITNGSGTITIAATGLALSSRTLTAGSGLVGGGDLSSDKTFNIGQGDGISVSADSIAVDSTVVRTTGTQDIGGSKTILEPWTFINSYNSYGDLGSYGDDMYFASLYGPQAFLESNISIFMPITGGTLALAEIDMIAGSGLNGGGTIAANRTFNIGQGDGISVSDNAIAVDSTVVRTTGNQSIGGEKTFTENVYVKDFVQFKGSGNNSLDLAHDGGTAGIRTDIIGQNPGGWKNKHLIIENGTVGDVSIDSNFGQVVLLGTSGVAISAGAASSGTHFAAFIDHSSTSVAGYPGGIVKTRTAAQVKSDIGLGNVTNDAQIKKLASTSGGYVPTWNGTTGDALNIGYSVETTLTGGTGALPRADAVKTYVDSMIGSGIATNDAMIFKGAIDCSTDPNYPAADRGWTYKVSVAGRIGGSSGPVVEVNDTLICSTDGTSAGTHASVGSNWVILQTNIADASILVTGPSSATSGNIPMFDGTTGKIIKDGGFLASNIVLTTGNQTIGGAKTFLGDMTIGNVVGGATVVIYGSGVNAGKIYASNTIDVPTATFGGSLDAGGVLSANGGGVNIMAPNTASTPTHFAAFTADPNSTKRIINSRTPTQVKTDLSLDNVQNTALSTWAGSTSITTLGTIGTGTWNATTIAVNKGGTGQPSYTNGQLLIGNSTGNTLSKATLTEGTGLDITNGAGSITIAHEDTSTLTGAQGSNGIASITVDGMGHVTAVTTATYLTAATVCAAITDCTLDGGTF